MNLLKKAIINIVLILVAFLIYFLQSNFFTWFNIAGIMPNLFVILIVFVGLFAGKKLGLILGLIFGTCLDFFIGRNIRYYSYSISYNRIYWRILR